MDQGITCKYIGHATVLINIGGTYILTDPHFGGRTLIAKRRLPLNINPSLLPDPAAVLISHTHFDHLNIKSYKYISQAVPIIVPEGCDGAITKFVSNPVIELSYFATHHLPDGTQITAVPIKHWGGRFSCLRYTKSNAYLISKGDRHIFFCGDSAYGPHFKEIGGLAPIDLALLPIACYLPRWFMHKRHMNPEEAVRACEDLRAKNMLPIHWGSFSLSMEPIDEPIAKLKKMVEERPELKDKIHIVGHGEEITLP